MNSNTKEARNWRDITQADLKGCQLHFFSLIITFETLYLHSCQPSCFFFSNKHNLKRKLFRDFFFLCGLKHVGNFNYLIKILVYSI